MARATVLSLLPFAIYQNARTFNKAQKTKTHGNWQNITTRSTGTQ